MLKSELRASAGPVAVAAEAPAAAGQSAGGLSPEEVESMRAALAASRRESEELREKVASVQAEHDGVVSALRAEIGGLTLAYNAADASQALLQAQVDAAAQGQVPASSSGASPASAPTAPELVDQNRALADELARARLRIETLEADLDAMTGAPRPAPPAASAAADAEAAGLRASLTAAQLELDAERAAAKRLESDVEAGRAEVERLTGEVEAAADRARASAHDLSEMSAAMTAAALARTAADHRVQVGFCPPLCPCPSRLTHSCAPPPRARSWRPACHTWVPPTRVRAGRHHPARRHLRLWLSLRLLLPRSGLGLPSWRLNTLISWCCWRLRT